MEKLKPKRFKSESKLNIINEYCDDKDRLRLSQSPQRRYLKRVLNKEYEIPQRYKKEQKQT